MGELRCKILGHKWALTPRMPKNAEQVQQDIGYIPASFVSYGPPKVCRRCQAVADA